MRLGSKGQYAVMAMVDLALHDHEGPVTLSAIAERQRLPVQYLEQLFPKLRRVGLVKSVRGSKGGYNMARTAEQIVVAEIILAVDESIQITRCSAKSSLGCQGKTSRCLTHDLWQGLGEHILDYLRGITLGHICTSTAPPREMSAI